MGYIFLSDIFIFFERKQQNVSNRTRAPYYLYLREMTAFSPYKPQVLEKNIPY